MKNLFLTAGLAGALFAGATPALADGEAEQAATNPWSGSLALTSDYRFRGISQSDSKVALQGSID